MSTRSSTASIRPLIILSPPNRRNCLCGLLSLSLITLSCAPQPVFAQWVVYDPSANTQALLSAARQIESLANEARSLANDARSLASSPYSHLAESSQTLRDIGALARTVRGAASTLEGVERQFSDLYPEDLSAADLVRLGGDRNATARRTAQDLARTAAELERLAQGRDRRLEGALSASQSAGGETAAIQSSTQMLSVLAEDLASMRTLLLAQSRLMAEGSARQAAERAASVEARRRFWEGRRSAPSAPVFDPFPNARD